MRRRRRWLRRLGRPVTRAQLIERKHTLEGEINVVASEVRRRRRLGQPTGDLERRLEQLRSRHYETRLEIDRTDPFP